MVRAISSKVVGVALWLPIKVTRHFLEPVTDMLDSLAQLSNEEFDDYFEEKPKND